MFINRCRIRIRTILLVNIISLFSFFSINVNAITCIDEEWCPAEIKKLDRFAKHGSPSAQIMLATLYADGTVVKKDLKRAFQLLRKASWHMPSISLGNHQLGVAYLKGLGTKKDLAKALILFNRAGDAGFVKSQLLLGVLYFDGKYLKQNFATAQHWFQKAANNNNSNAAFLLAHMKENGLGVIKDLKEAEKWYMTAAKNNNPLAIKRLSQLHPENTSVILEQYQSTSTENKLVITRSEIPRMELVDLFNGQIEQTKLYHRVAPTGSHMPGKICGKNADMCSSTTGEENIREYMFDLTGFR